MGFGTSPFLRGKFPFPPQQYTTSAIHQEVKSMKKMLRYVASCLFTRDMPELSLKIQRYIHSLDIEIIRCCLPNYAVKEFEESIRISFKEHWKALPHYREFHNNETMVYVCHTCSAIFEERKAETDRVSLWELIVQDDAFQYKDFANEKITIQDCWRSFDNEKEQSAVRQILQNMQIDIVEMEENREKTQFCGISTLAPTLKKNLVNAPVRFVENAKGKFLSHTQEEKDALMQKHAEKIPTDKVICYCNACLKGLQLTRKTSYHLAELLF